MNKEQLTPIEACFQRANSEGRSALIPFCVAGHPSRSSFGSTLMQIAQHADLIEIGVPFSDPLADGPVIAEVSRERAAAGVTLQWLFDCIEGLPGPLRAPPVLFSYLNPLMAYGLQRALGRMASLGFAGLVVPDLPLGECAELQTLARAEGLALIQLVTPLTSDRRAATIAGTSDGFLYAVLRSGITGARTEVSSSIDFLRRLRQASELPVCAGFGLRDAAQIQELRCEADGLIIGTALVQHLAAGLPPAELLQDLFNATTH